MSVQGLAHKAFGSSKISVFAEVEFHRGAGLVDGPVEILPFATDLYIRLIQMPFAKDAALAATERLEQLWREAHHQRWMVE